MSFAELIRVAEHGIHRAPPADDKQCRRRSNTYNTGASHDVLAYCGEPRTMDAVVDELGDGAKFTVWNLVKHKKLVNLRGPRQKGLYVLAERAAEFAQLATPSPKARIKIGRATARETLVWHRMAGRNLLPDADTTVLIRVLNPDGEPVWPGFHDGERWRYADGAPVGRTVLARAEMPAGPEA